MRMGVKSKESCYFRLDDEEGAENNNTPIALTIASAYFEIGRSNVINKLENGDN